MLVLPWLLGANCGKPPKLDLDAVPEFPWPPPEPSSRRDLPLEWLLSETAGATLGDLDARLAATLASAGYVSRAYFAVPRGFAVVTQLEQIEADGSPKPDPPRWSLEQEALQRFSIGDYLKRLLAADPGYFRVVVFVVTPVAFATTGEAISVSEIQAWPRTGLVTLPPQLAGIALGDAPFACVALVYEFERRAAGEPAELRVPGRLGVESHLAALRFPARETE